MWLNEIQTKMKLNPQLLVYRILKIFAIRKTYNMAKKPLFCWWIGYILQIFMKNERQEHSPYEFIRYYRWISDKYPLWLKLDFLKGFSMKNQFESQAYLNLETFRKSGVGVKTPVWFVQQDNLLYVWTQAASGKVKRIRVNPAVRVTPCKVNGTVIGEWQNAQARVLVEPQARRVDQLMKKKYGIQMMVFSLIAAIKKTPYVGLSIQLET